MYFFIIYHYIIGKIGFSPHIKFRYILIYFGFLINPYNKQLILIEQSFKRFCVKFELLLHLNHKEYKKLFFSTILAYKIKKHEGDLQ